MVIGGALGWLAGIGALAIPGLGPFIAAGPIMGLLGGWVPGRFGGIAGALIGHGHTGVRGQALRRPCQRRRDSILRPLRQRRVVERAKEIMERTGARDIASAGEAAADYDKSDRPMPRTILDRP